MLNSERALVYLLSMVSEIAGRKRLQKMVYLLQRTGAPYHEKFSYHHYGPYSSELQAEVDRLVDLALLEEEYNNRCYIYKITKEGESFLENYNKIIGDSFDLPQNTISQLMKVNTSVLEMASTYAYLLEMGYKEQDALKKALELKPHLGCYLEDAKNLLLEIQK